MYAFKVPDIGEGVVEAEVLAWRVSEGDRVSEDQVLVELLTDKAEIEIPSPRAGRVHRLHFEVGEVAHVGDVLIEIEEAGAASTPEPDAARTADTSAAEAGTDDATAAAAPPLSEAPPGRRTRAEEVRPEAADPAHAKRPPQMPERPRGRGAASGREGAVARAPVEAVPAVRELAKRLGVDLEQVRGTGPRGRVMRRDVEAHVAGQPAAATEDGAGARDPGRDASASARARAAEPAQDPADWTREPLRGVRRAIAERMTLSRRTAAHFTFVDEVDLSALLERLERWEGERVSPLAFIARAVVRALAGFPILNASIDDARGEIVLKGRVHLGIAAATEQGLVVPVIRDAADLDARQLAERIRALGAGARGGSLKPTELRGSTFTITSLGKLGGVISTPILNPPEVAILGVNAIRRLPRAVDDRIEVRSVMNLSLSVDHRIADGMVAAQYVQELKRILEGVAFEELASEGVD